MANPQAEDLSDLQRRMDGAIAAFQQELQGLRTGRASAHLVDGIVVEAYNTRMPINQVGTVSVPEPRLISIQVWDKSMIQPIDRAIREAGLGLNPVVDGQLVRIPIPELTEERRKELAKIAHKYAEGARVAVRNVRRDGMEKLKKHEKDGDIGQDEHKQLSDKVQKLTDEHVKKVDEMLAQKEREIMQV
jgi:ribosome recycling factor